MLMDEPVEGMLIRVSELPKPIPDEVPMSMVWWSRQYSTPLSSRI